MLLYVYTLNEVSGEIKESVIEVRETEKTYWVKSGYIPGTYISLVRKADMPYIKGTYVSTEREPEAARKVFLDKVEFQFESAIRKTERLKALKSAIENCQIKETEGELK